MNEILLDVLGGAFVLSVVVLAVGRTIIMGYRAWIWCFPPREPCPHEWIEQKADGVVTYKKKLRKKDEKVVIQLRSCLVCGAQEAWQVHFEKKIKIEPLWAEQFIARKSKEEKKDG